MTLGVLLSGVRSTERSQCEAWKVILGFLLGLLFGDILRIVKS
jgi:hypothetical protein